MLSQIKNVALVGVSSLGTQKTTWSWINNLKPGQRQPRGDHPGPLSRTSRLNPPRLCLDERGFQCRIPYWLECHIDRLQPKSLENGLKGQDVVIMLLPPESTVDHETIIDAAVRAGVKHFFPSEYGIRMYHPEFANNVVLATKKRSIVKHLERTQDYMSWTGLICNPWVDFVRLPRGSFKYLP